MESLRKVQRDTNSFLTELIASRGELNGAAANDNTAIDDDDDDNDDDSSDDDSMNKEPLEKIAKLIWGIKTKQQKMSGVWTKKLYERSGLPDNYTPKESFLAAIERNKDLRLYSRRECLQGASLLGRELSLLITFWSLYLYLRYP